MLERVLRTVVRCRVCGFAELRTDEVIDRGLVLLCECPRCEHRSTARAPLVAPVRSLRARAREEASEEIREVLPAA